MNTTTKLIQDKKTAIKIINKYAQSYNQISEENKILKSEINDLRANININKDIIRDLLLSQKTIKDHTICDKLSSELRSLYAQNQKISNQRIELQQKLTQNESMWSEIINKLKEENEKSHIKNFLLEQTIEKNETQIEILKYKLSKIKKENVYEKEIYVLEPNTSIVRLNDELILYKQIYRKLLFSLRKNEKKKQQYEETLEQLQKEIYNLRKKYRISLESNNKKKETILTLLSQNTRSIIDNTQNSKTYKSANIILSNYPNEGSIGAKLRVNLNVKPIASRVNEFRDILRILKITDEEYVKMANKKINEKLIDIIEHMFKLINEKNMTINVLERENSNLTMKNFELNKMNMTLNEEIAKLKGKGNENYNSESFVCNNNMNKSEETMDNNTSALTVNRELMIKSLLTYQKGLEKNHKEVNNDSTLSEGSEFNKNILQIHNREDLNNLKGNRISLDNSYNSSENESHNKNSNLSI